MIENPSKRKRLNEELTYLSVKPSDLNMVVSLLAVTVPSAKSDTLKEGVELINMVRADVVNIEQDISNLSECPYCKVVAAIKQLYNMDIH